MHTNDTIAAISTPPGQGGIGIVRLSGQDAIRIADRIFISPKGKKLSVTPSHRIVYGHITDPDSKSLIDEALVSVMKAPNTYTREDVVEINCHGGIIPLRRTLELLLARGARMAGPGEFTQRAFMNGRIDLVQAEAVLDIINSLTEKSQKSAMKQLSGSLSAGISAIRDHLIELAAFVEAHIDFPEEEMGPPSTKNIEQDALIVKEALENMIRSSRHGIILREGMHTAIIGRPNVGKSSLLNALLEQERAIVTELPGTTRDVIEDYLNIQGIPVKFMDTAGIRKVGNVAEQEGVMRSLKSMEEADLILLVLDGSETLHDTDRELINKSKNKNTIYVINKIDLPQTIPPPVEDGRTVMISALTGAGIDALKDRVIETVFEGSVEVSADTVTNVRHVHALERALSSVVSFIRENREGASPEFLSVELRDALDAIGEIQGITTPDDVLNRIFSRFCIGK